MFRLIEGGKAVPFAVEEVWDRQSMVVAEGRRRLQAAGVERYETRERVAGIAMPKSLKYFKLQVDFAVVALTQLSPIPVDYMLDGYWPKLDLGM
ncbi:hypothetical protein JNB88_31350 [Rhizobium cauense]|uniref:hypothetical protein n=1 Tax=Rhizobium cauense TaxID=1166683 RepID=UPI001C6E5DE8|nr:hypothetical protein [Rhizobium cauense]MBW9118112.1 hypothetical protein [Rhizobium cauense]